MNLSGRTIDIMRQSQEPNSLLRARAERRSSELPSLAGLLRECSMTDGRSKLIVCVRTAHATPVRFCMGQRDELRGHSDNKRLITYTLAEEGGASLRASGFRCIGEAGGGRWSRESRPRVDTHPLQVKLKWEVTA